MIAKYRHIPVMIVHLIYIYQYIQLDDSYRRLLKNVQLENPLPIFHRNRKLHKFHFAFIQLAIETNRCPYIDPTFNEKILNLVSLQRAKFYQELFCVCQQCFFGNRCQFTTSQYSISLDALIGPMVAIEKELCLNTTAAFLFIVRHKCRSTGRGLYIIDLSILGTYCLVILALKFIPIVLLPYVSNRLNCIFIEYFLKCLPTIVDWLNTCVLLKRIWFIQSGFHFDKVKKIAKSTIPTDCLCWLKSTP
ncbi:unnamed protein product [Rotaria magnacalcarata]|uniref:Uncharacterized protein n=2 Tax=Rotaria magnacalcarata TaxID=392030 RepID=A0A815J0Q2_9BILA|nr:unnamed protein product [Rotaria magnacalcarata]CAF1400584.1 unnamed protein product [Rotaria magnacalcarata]CAF4785260.1 unnamed protein product [Rotaria magnacalcarata]